VHRISQATDAKEEKVSDQTVDDNNKQEPTGNEQKEGHGWWWNEVITENQHKAHD